MWGQVIFALLLTAFAVDQLVLCALAAAAYLYEQWAPPPGHPRYNALYRRGQPQQRKQRAGFLSGKRSPSFSSEDSWKIGTPRSARSSGGAPAGDAAFSWRDNDLEMPKQDQDKVYWQSVRVPAVKQRHRDDDLEAGPFAKVPVSKRAQQVRRCDSSDDISPSSSVGSSVGSTADSSHDQLVIIVGDGDVPVIGRAARPDDESPQQHYQPHADTPSAAALAAGVHECLIDQYESHTGGGGYPLVLVQLPLFNETTHCELITERCCRIAWPRDRLIVQLCDDSTDADVRQRVDRKMEEMRALGHDVRVVRRYGDRTGFKAGGMAAGLAAVKDLAPEYVAIFDADFEPPADFLYQTIFHLQADPRLGFVQTRWTFINTYDSVLTWGQYINLNFHFMIEQRARSFARSFFNFNGTAGVWRLAAIEDAGGWAFDNTVEDMDLSIRAYLRGWKFRYLDHVRCPNELPPTLEIYKTQQFRWLAGPMAVAKKIFGEIWAPRNRHVSLLDRAWCSYFFLRYIYFGVVTGCTILLPMLHLYIDPWMFNLHGVWSTSAGLLINFLPAFYTLWWPMYAIFATVTGYFRFYCMVCGIMGTARSKTWKVTTKLGTQGPGLAAHRNLGAPYKIELICALYYACMGLWAWHSDALWMLLYCATLSSAFWVAAFGDYLL